jgi:retron-type reverse transcriptase
METQRKQTTSYEGCSQERRLEAGRNAHQAVNKAKEYINDGYTWVVDIDLEKYFDTVQHDKLMSLVARKVQDKRVLKLIRAYCYKT